MLHFEWHCQKDIYVTMFIIVVQLAAVYKLSSIVVRALLAWGMGKAEHWQFTAGEKWNNFQLNWNELWASLIVGISFSRLCFQVLAGHPVCGPVCFFFLPLQSSDPCVRLYCTFPSYIASVIAACSRPCGATFRMKISWHPQSTVIRLITPHLYPYLLSLLHTHGGW